MTASLILAVASCLIPAAYLLAVSRGRFWRAATLWLVWPGIVYVGLAVWETLTRGPFPLTNVLLGFSLISAFLIIPWLIISTVVLGLAFVLRSVFKRSKPQQVEPAPMKPMRSRPKPESSVNGECEGRDDPTVEAALRSTQPNGTIRVEFEPVEWYNNLWMSPPRVTDVLTEKIILDLWGQDWDAQVGFPGPRQVVLRCSRFSGAEVTFTINLEKQTYQILQLRNIGGPFPPASIGPIAQDLEDACRRSVAAGPALPGPGTQNAPTRSSWRPAMIILLGMSAMIVAIAFLAQHLDKGGARSAPIIAVPKGGFRPAGQGEADPKVALVVESQLRPSRNLVIGRKRSQFPDETEASFEMRRAVWMLPPHRGVTLMPVEWSLRDMARLSDLF